MFSVSVSLTHPPGGPNPTPLPDATYVEEDDPVPYGVGREGGYVAWPLGPCLVRAEDVRVEDIGRDSERDDAPLLLR